MRDVSGALVLVEHDMRLPDSDTSTVSMTRTMSALPLDRVSQRRDIVVTSHVRVQFYRGWWNMSSLPRLPWRIPPHGRIPRIWDGWTTVGLQ